MKHCSSCGLDKPYSDFNRKRSAKDGYQPHCRKCSNTLSKGYYEANKPARLIQIAKWNKEAYAAIRKQLIDLKTYNGCGLCDESDECCLDFHHLDPSQKIDAVSNICKLQSWRLLIEEIDKCVLICANCHRKVHKGKKNIRQARHLKYNKFFKAKIKDMRRPDVLPIFSTVPSC